MSWQQVFLREVLTLHYGKALPKEDRNPSGSIPLYGANGIKEYSDQSLSTGPSLIIGRKGSAGEITRVEGPFWPLDVTYYTEHDDTRVDFDFLEYALRIMDLPSHAKGVKPGINRNEVYGLPICLPPLEEQKRIVAVLDQAFATLNRARANAEANLADTEELFGNAVQAAIDELENRYGTKALEDNVEFKNGFAFKSAKFTSDGEPVARISNIQDGKIDLTKVVFTRREDYSEDLSKYEIHSDELLIAMSGATTGKIGFNRTDRVLLQNQRVGRFTKKSKMNLEYLAYFLETKVEEHLLDICWCSAT